MKNNHKPEIRFPGYTGEWEQRKLGDISDIKTGPFGSTLHAEDYVENGTPIITTEHFKNGKLPLYNEGIPQVSDEDLERLKSYILNSEDIVFSRVGSVDINALVTDQQAGWLFSGRVLRVRSDEEINSQFLHYELSTDRVKNDVISRAVGQTMPSINTEILKETKVVIFNEKKVQEKIGNFFKEIDDLLSLHQQKLTALKQTKQGFLQKMFPKEEASMPEIRFPGFTSDWEQRKLGEISEKVTEKNKNNIYSETLTNSAEFGIINQRDFFDKDISNEKNLDGYYVVRPDDFVYNPRISNLAPVGPIKRNKLGRTGVMSPLYHVFRTHDVDKAYLEKYFSSNSWHIFMKLNGDSGARSDRFAIKDSLFREMPIPIPSIEEQTKIGKFFKQLDDTIALHQRELDALKETKKAFLQKMFA
ncbi:restriction endonuclease subunit S [Bacillus nitratireducens]|uniref:restriction endonuclease subunit S n=1 Tax=Bacillus nitratireducens TaxID=2026193 RepID=UPI001BEDA698|nr:restriction endonuclease subunit S [Bacillus nitratireducens]QUG82489.1 restriction endonuclease subunit S [Bacillus nitratireducens]